MISSAGNSDFLIFIVLSLNFLAKIYCLLNLRFFVAELVLSVKKNFLLKKKANVKKRLTLFFA